MAKTTFSGPVLEGKEGTNIETKTSDSLLKKMMELVLFGDLFSISLSDELGMIPEDIEGIENLKEMLGE